MIQDIQKVQRELEGKFLADQPEVDKAAAALYEAVAAAGQGLPDAVRRGAGDEVVNRWRSWRELLYKYLDGNVKDAPGR